MEKLTAGTKFDVAINFLNTEQIFSLQKVGDFG